MSLRESYVLETGQELEIYVKGSLENAGFETSMTPTTGDAGCDLIAKKGKHVILIQVKQVQSDKTCAIGVRDVLNASERYKYQRPTKLALITNAKMVTKAQADLATAKGVIILRGDSIDNYGGALVTKMDG